MSFQRAIQDHFEEHSAVISATSETLVEPICTMAAIVLDTVRNRGTMFFCGNGGSAADAQHLAAEYVVRFERSRPSVAAIALTTDTSILTAGGNDLGFKSVFERQLRALARAGDLLILHSTSGESENLLRAASTARELGVKTVAVLAKGGGSLAQEVDLALVVPTNSTARAQEIQLTIGHIVCDLVDEAVANSA
jgi:D-sedoheptulose 7-phosphate isomerase